MFRSTVRPRLARGAGTAGALLCMLIAACGSGKAGLAGAPLEPPEVLAALNGGVEVRHGGFGSALARDPSDTLSFLLLADRGPNVDGFRPGEKIFPVPAFTPRIGRFRLQGRRFVRTAVIPLKDEAGRPLSGLPQPPGPGATGELGTDLSGTPLPSRGKAPAGYSERGFDLEGLAVMSDGSFWLADEYGPFLLHVSPGGRLRQRVSPFGGQHSLPALLARRRPNFGMEGLARLPDGTLMGLMQGPLENPGPDVPGIRRTRVTRMVWYDPASGRSRQYLLLLERPDLMNTAIAARSPTSFLTIERDTGLPGAGGTVKRIYRVDVRRATDVGGDPRSPAGLLVGGHTLEELTIDARDPAALLAAHGIRPAAKVLAADLLELGAPYPHDKPEGIAMVDDSTVAVSNDDDFGLVGGDVPGEVRQKRDYGEIRFVRIRWSRGLHQSTSRSGITSAR
jgi:hypothetical protein